MRIALQFRASFDFQLVSCGKASVNSSSFLFFLFFCYLLRNRRGMCMEMSEVTEALEAYFLVITFFENS